VAKDSENSEPGEITIDTHANDGLNTEALEKAFKKSSGEKSSSKAHSELEAENQKLKNDILYLRAEFDNFRKQSIKERSEMIKYGAERFIRQLLNVVDNFERALAMEVNTENYQNFHKGIELTSHEFKNQLSNMGVKIEDPMGKPFDPNLHEALSSEETNDFEPGHICKVFQKTYFLHDKVIRPAQVLVAKAPSTSGGEKNKQEE
jgi:molecular chaperone GrpE